MISLTEWLLSRTMPIGPSLSATFARPEPRSFAFERMDTGVLSSTWNLGAINGGAAINSIATHRNDYTSGPNVVCPAEWNCSREEIATYLARHSVPGRDWSRPAFNGSIPGAGAGRPR